ncbi:hypothetical protein HYX10_04610 [Candidatus Woesearchaeota archaeon]|nr:hypothetical protein [Candidatus Woesearchaeota archaeon]
MKMSGAVFGGKSGKPLVVVFDDADVVLEAFKGEVQKIDPEAKFDFFLSNNPDEVFKAAKKLSARLAILDFAIADPQSKPYAFKNGLALAEAIKDFRGKGIDVVMMSSHEVSGANISQLVTNHPFLSGSYDKAKLYDELPDILNCVLGKSQPYPRLVVVEGPAGAGKTTLSDIRKLVSRLEVLFSATTRPPREGELGQGLGKKGLRDNDHYFLSQEEFDAWRNSARRPFVYRDENENWVYGHDLSSIDDALESGSSALMATRHLSLVDEVMRQYREQCLVVYLASDPADVKKGLEQHRGSSHGLLTNGELGQYVKRAHLILNTNPLHKSLPNNFNRTRASVEIQDRIVAAIDFAVMHYPYGEPMHGLNQFYVEKLSGALAGVLKKGAVITIPGDLVRDYCEGLEGISNLAQEHIRELSQILVTDVSDAGGVITATLAPNAAADSGTYTTSIMQKNALTGLIAFYLDRKGFSPVKLNLFDPYRVGAGVSIPKAVYQLSDMNVGQGPFALELLIG